MEDDSQHKPLTKEALLSLLKEHLTVDLSDLGGSSLKLTVYFGETLICESIEDLSEVATQEHVRAEIQGIPDWMR